MRRAGGAGPSAESRARRSGAARLARLTVLVLALVCLAGVAAALDPASAPRRLRPPRAVVTPRPAASTMARTPAVATALPPGAAVGAPASAAVRRLAGAAYLGVNDLARLLDATKFWRSDVRKLVLRAGSHRVVLIADDPFALVDNATVWLEFPVRSLGGELQVPVTLLAALPRDSTLARLHYEPERNLVLVLPPGGVVGTPRLAVEGGVTRLVFPSDHPEDALVVTRGRAHFRVRLGAFFIGVLPDSFPPGGLLRGAQALPAVTGSAFEFEVAREAGGFRLTRDLAAKQVTLEFSRGAVGTFEEFALEGPPGARPVRVVVLDPGHGGADAGATAEGVVEKDLTLAMARQLRAELERRGRMRVVLTREDDRALTSDQRAEAANRARADLVLSLHFDGFGRPEAHGATALCPPATYVPAPAAGSGTPPIAVVPWRDVATRYAVQSRALAEAILGTLELRGLGPTRLHELLPASLLGVNAPGILLECATLTSPGDRQRIAGPAGLRTLTITLADGIEAYRRHE